MGYFDINYTQLIRQLLPVRLRQERQVAWITVLIAPVMWLYSVFADFRLKNLYDLAHNGQVCKLEAVLNDAFDTDDRGIYISDYLYAEPVWLWVDAELHPVWVYTDDEDLPVWLWTDDEIDITTGRFVVNIPDDLTIDNNRLTGLLKKYKLAGMQYQIIYYTR